MRKITSAIRPTLPKPPKLPARTNIAQPKRPAVPRPTSPAPKSKLGKTTQGVSQALEIHKHIADTVINSHNLVTPGAVLAAHAVEKSTGLNNLSAFSGGSGIHHKVKH